MPPTQPPSVRNEFIQWYNDIPPITRTMLTMTSVFSLNAIFQFVRSDRLYLIWPLILRKWELWRLVTNFFTCHVDLTFIFNLYFMYTYSVKLETEVFQGQPADYVYFLLFNSAIQLLLDNYFQKVFTLSRAVVPSIMYLWSKHNADQEVSFMFGFRFKAIFLPWVVAAYEYIGTSGIIPYATLYGIASSHLYYYFKTVYPRTGGRQYLTTPGFLQRWFPPTIGSYRSSGVGYVWTNNQQRQRTQERTNIMGGHNWGRGHRLT
ncbi:Der1-like family-domain-containing protein [Halteromyces radiatus]|uniref:Der1-like family-domain-containing protein n=1 Tax=Halteromyces radiatus TaxID=101107 RepID=UPI00221F57F2|nr:Der1-like family-domain-containing protein [Halteromyces radiatus]KAI8081273.1 Der1-like family-domain-containing protein [Halteromyces radiatus]